MSSANVTHSQSALAATGWNPPTTAPLDRPRILQSASEEIRTARAEVIVSRGGDLTSDNSNKLILPSDRDILANGLGFMVSPEEVTEMASQLSYSGPTASNLFQLAARTAKHDEGRRRHMSETANLPDDP
jgi:hypothetical protein